jgi:hypothetical protein
MWQNWKNVSIDCIGIQSESRQALASDLHVSVMCDRRAFRVQKQKALNLLKVKGFRV